MPAAHCCWPHSIVRVACPATLRSQGVGDPRAAAGLLEEGSWHAYREEERLDEDAHKKEMNREEEVNR